MSMIVLSTTPGINNTFIQEEVSADGDCGYTSIARGINLKLSKLENSGSLRSQVADYIFKNWDNKLGALDIKTIVKTSILERQRKYNDFSNFFNIQDNEIKEDDDAIKNKYCSFLISAESGKLWIEDFNIKILEKIFNINIVTVNQKDNKWSDVSERATASADESNKIYILYNGVDHYDFLINIKDKIINSCLEKNKQLVATIAQYIDKTADWLLRAKEQDIREEILKLLTTLEQKGQLELQKFYEKLSLHFFGKKPNTAQENSKQTNTNQDAFEGFFKYCFDIISSPKFIESFTKFCKILKTIFHKLTVAFNPGSELDDSEITGKYAEYGKYSEVFNAAGEAGRKFYRQLLERVDNGENFTSKQFLNVLLYTLKHDKAKLFSRSGHQMCTIMEEMIFGDKDDFGQEIEKNLKAAFSRYVKKDAYNADTQTSLITVAKDYAVKLKEKLDELKQYIISEEDVPENKNALFQILQYDRLKLVHFMLKIQAFSKGQTLSIDKSFNSNFTDYLDKLSKVKNTREEVNDSQNKTSIFKLFGGEIYNNNLLVKGKFQDALNQANHSRAIELNDFKNNMMHRLDTLRQELEELHQFNNQLLSNEGNQDVIINIINAINLLDLKLSNMQSSLQNDNDIGDTLTVNDYHARYAELDKQNNNLLVLENQVNEIRNYYSRGLSLESPQVTQDDSVFDPKVVPMNQFSRAVTA